MRSKKGVTGMMNFLVYLIIALLLFGTAFYIVGKVFRLSDQGMDGFDAFSDKVLEAVIDGKIFERTPYNLVMDKGTAIFLFNAYEKEIVYKIKKPSESYIFMADPMGPGMSMEELREAKKALQTMATYRIPRPKQAGLESESYICICQRGTLENYVYTCDAKKITCKMIPTLKVPEGSEISEYKVEGSCGQVNHHYLNVSEITQECVGGMVIEREGISTPIKIKRPRAQTAYIYRLTESQLFVFE